MDEKIIELETKFSFQEDLLQALNETIIRQQRQLDQLQLELTRMQALLLELQAGPEIDDPTQAHEKPPHY